VFIDATAATSSIDPSTGLPGHEHGPRASGRDWEDVEVFVVVSPDGAVYARSPMQDPPTVDLRRAIATHDARMHLDDGPGWMDILA
jgi:hypothetical protein